MENKLPFGTTFHYYAQKAEDGSFDYVFPYEKISKMGDSNDTKIVKVKVTIVDKDSGTCCGWHNYNQKIVVVFKTLRQLNCSFSRGFEKYIDKKGEIVHLKIEEEK